MKKRIVLNSKKKIVVKRKLRSLRISRRSPSTSQVDFDFNASARRNPNWRRRCGCSTIGPCDTREWGQSFITIHNQSGRYRIKVYINSYGRALWGRAATFDERWDRFVNAARSYIRLRSDIIQPRGTWGGYFFNGNNQTPCDARVGCGRAGTLGLEVLDGNNNTVHRILWYSQTWGDWGTEWLRCGQDYTFTFTEALIQARTRK